MASTLSEAKVPLDLMTDMCLSVYRGWTEVFLSSLTPWTQPQANPMVTVASQSMDQAAEFMDSVSETLDGQHQKAQLDERESRINQRDAEIAKRESDISRREEQSIPVPKLEPEELQLSETDDEIVITAEFPGFGADEVEARVRKGRLTIKGEKHQADQEGESHLSYRRQLSLPVPAAARESTSNYHDGVVEVRIPKSPPPEGKQPSANVKERPKQKSVPRGTRGTRATRKKPTAKRRPKSRERTR